MFSWRRKREDDLERELRSHLETEAEERDDPYAARRALGNLARVKEDVRDAWGWMWMERLGQDLRYALRTMRQSPGFTATAVLSLALGIGANTAIFSLIDALMLRWLPVRDPQELVQVQIQSGGQGRGSGSFSYPVVRALADRREIFSGLFGVSRAGFVVGSGGGVQQVFGCWVTGDYYQTLGLNPSLGRLLSREDNHPGAPVVAVISDGYWERQFARNPGIVGQTVSVNGFPTTIVGVSPPGFEGVNVGAKADITLPLGALPLLTPESASLLNIGNHWIRVLARPQKGVSIPQIGAHLAAIWPNVARTIAPSGAPEARMKALAESTFQFLPGGTGYTYLRETFRKPLLVLMAVVALVLLIACANVANLLLARSAARQREIAVRLAIGAGRGRIIRQLLTESVLLSSLGAAFGIGLAWLVSRSLIDLLATGPARVIFDLTPNPHVLGFTGAIAIATGVLFGLVPAFQTTAAGSSPVLDGDVRMGRSRSRLLSSLVSAQVALSLLLLVGAGLFVRTLRNLQNLAPGFQPEGVLLVSVSGQREGYRDDRLMAFNNELLDQVQRVPGVMSASISNNTPMSGGTWTQAAVPMGQPLPENDNADFVAVGPRHFETMRTPLLSGREFTEHDNGSPSVAIVNETFARLYFPNQNPVGQHLSATGFRPTADLEIVGEVKDTITDGLRSAPPATVYVSYFQRASDEAALEIRVVGPLSEVSSAIQKELQPRLPSTPVAVRALTDQLEATLLQERMMATLASGFGVLALVLACIGLYGLLAYSVARRTKELGIRMALGAQQRRVIAMVVKAAIRLVAIGIALGLPAAWLASRWVESMLFGLTPTDPATIAGAAGLMISAALLAAYLPARRASRVDPMTALRHD